jgi:hypothetical protein
MVDLGKYRCEAARVVGHQRQAVRVGMEYGEFTVAAGLAIPELAVQRRAGRSLRHGVLEVVVGPGLLGYREFAEVLDVDSH